MNRPVSADEFKQIGAFQSLRKTLLQERFADRIDRPLAYWALPGDRRLPLAFLGRTLRELLSAEYENLAATPGIGKKKMGTMLALLSRATTTRPADAEPLDGATPANPAAAQQHGDDGFNPSQVSEALWEEWRQTVRRHQVGNHTLGRLAPRLQAVPTVIWHTPLLNYLDYSLAEIRQLKTHGEKRVRTILQVFYGVHQVLSQAGAESHLSVRLAPTFLLPLERWIADTAVQNRVPPTAEVRRWLVEPLLAQLEIDAGPTVAKLADGRLGIHSAVQSVRQQARKLGVTRARVYQLLDDCALVMAVRWPEGAAEMSRLLEKLAPLAGPNDNLGLLRATCELFFSGVVRGPGEPGEEHAAPDRHEALAGSGTHE